MCGISGYSIAAGYRFPQGSLDSSSKAIAHRGPDDSGILEDESRGIGLAHRRLSILDLSPMGHQPMVSVDESVVLIFNGEIYNFIELRSELESKGVKFRGNSDTEVLLSLYLHEGESMLSRLNGIFALAIWDKNSQSLLLARDALGVKPLYYSEKDGWFVFGSEIKALLPLMQECGPLDEIAIQRYLTFLWCPGDGTPFQLVRKLLPGEAMVVRSGRIDRRWTWYKLPIFKSSYKKRTNVNELIEGVSDHLRMAVNRQMVADVPVGAFLSGGLDSSTIVALAREQNPNLRCFTIESEGGQEAETTDDLPYARKVAKHLNVPLDIVRIDAKRMANDLEHMVAQLDEPLADPAPLNVFYISKFAREHGIKVLLSGAAGDDLFTGYRRHRAIVVEQWWAWAPRPLRRLLSTATGSLDQRSALARRVTKLFKGAGMDAEDRLVNYFCWVDRPDLERLYTEDFRAALGDSQAQAPMLDFLHSLPLEATQLERVLALEQRFFLPDHNLLYTDKMSMAVGVEVRVPFLDLEMVEYASLIPDKFKQRGMEGKWILKKAMEPYLPREVIYRPKTGFGAPLRRWMRHDLRELLGDMLSEDSVKHRGIFSSAAVQQLVADNDNGRVDASYTLLSLLCIEIWCRAFMDTKNSSKISTESNNSFSRSLLN